MHAGKPKCMRMQKAFQDREAALLHKERAVNEGARSLEERTGGVTAREGRLQGLEALKVQVDADKAALEQRRMQLDSAETEARFLPLYLHLLETPLIWLLDVPVLMCVN